MAPFCLLSWVRRLGPGLTQGLKAGPGGPERELLGEAECHLKYYVLCWVWEHCSFHIVAKVGPSPKFTECRTSLLDFSPTPGLGHLFRNPFLDSHSSGIFSWHYFCILCILLGKLSDYQFFECASIRYQCIVQSYNTGSISLNQQVFTLYMPSSLCVSNGLPSVCLCPDLLFL